LLGISTLISVSFFVLDLIGTDKLCGGRQYTECMQSAHSFLIIFVPILPTFVFSLITYWMRAEVYTTWFRFARWWVPLSMLAIFLAPEYSSNFLSPVEKGTVALFFSALFVIASLIIIVSKWYRLRSK